MDPLPVEAFLADYPGQIRDIAEWLRGVVRRAVPGATERVRLGWRIIGFDVPVGPRRSAYFAWVMVEAVHVHLGFPNGVLMAHARAGLEGAGITKRARWVTLSPGSMLPEADLAELARDAARVATLSRGERLVIAMAQAEANGA